MLNLRLLLALCLGISVPWAWAQDYPTKPIRVIVPLAPGGAVDSVARGIATGLTESLKQTVVVDNRAGAAGSIGAELTARAAPDGYTLLVASASFSIYPLMNPGSYDPVRDFAPVSLAVSLPLVLAVNPTVPANTVSELIALARAKPGTLNYGSSGSGGFPHLAGELLKAMTGTNIVHIPYKGNAAAMTDVIAGQIQFMFASPGLSIPHIKSGRLRGLAVSSRTRSKSAPEFPPLHEAGVPGFDVTQWIGVLAPAKTPHPVIDRLQRGIVAALQRPELIARLAIEGLDPVASSPEQFEQIISSELEKWRKVIKEAGIRTE